MKISFSHQKYKLKFKFLAGTSRGILKEKNSHFIFLKNEKGITGIGEAAPLSGLSIDFETLPKFIEKYCNKFNNNNLKNINDLFIPELESYPSLKFALEVAISDLENNGTKKIMNNDFFDKTEKIKINGLVWMNSIQNMKKQIRNKIEEGFDCIKIKIGALDFEEEIGLLKEIRKEYNQNDIEIRVDANGGFSKETALEKLKRISELNLHSIEQPITPNQIEEMKHLCEKSPLPIALDEELIGIKNYKELLETIKPKYIILKPSLIGGIKKCNEIIKLAEKLSIEWWITSALESNIGLNAISQWTSSLKTNLPQGLGTGQLYENNITSPLIIEKGHLIYDQTKKWDISKLDIKV